MSNILPSKTITVAVGTCNKKRRVKKPWWNDNLSELWNERCNREKIYCRSVGLDKQHQRHLFRLSQNAFDREVQGAKRKHWRKQQDKLLTLRNSDSKQFWKSIGNIGVRTETQSIPWKAVNSETNTVITEPVQVLSQWENDFTKLLNPITGGLVDHTHDTKP